MEVRKFKNLFGNIALSNDFEKSFGGWVKESNECIVVLVLQKSNFGNYYDLNVKTYIKGIFGKTYMINKNLIKKDIGNILMRQPKEFNEILDLDNPISVKDRQLEIEKMFTSFIVPSTQKLLEMDGIRDLYKKQELFLLPAIKKELKI